MQYQKLMNLLGNTSDQLSTFKTIDWTEINDQSRGVYNTNYAITFTTIMVKSSLCDYCDSYILIEGRITIIGEGDDATARQTVERNKGVIFKNGASFINYKSEINNTEIDNAKDTDIIMLLYNLIEYSDNYSKTSPVLWQYYKHEPNDNLTDSELFKCKLKITGNTPADGNKIFKQFLENSLEMPLIN